MYPLPQNKFITVHRFNRCQSRLATHINCSLTTKSRRRNDNQIALEETPPVPTLPPLASSSQTPRPTVRNDSSLQSTWNHRGWLASGCTTVLVTLARSIVNSSNENLLLEQIVAGLIGYVLADLGSGVYHWAIDNYGDASTPVFGSQIEAFQGHHKWPWTITRRQFANNLHALSRVVTFVVLPMDLAISDPVLLSFIGVCSGCILFSQQFHAWAHGTKSKLPPVVVALQESGVLVSRSQHAAHHKQPYNNNYCIVSGAWNQFLDELKVFEALELILFFKLGVRPRSWSEPNSGWTEETEAHLPQTS